MKFDLERRIANAVKRLHAQIDDWTGDATWHVGQDAHRVRFKTNERFNTAARSIGQSRRQRNQRAQAQ